MHRKHPKTRFVNAHMAMLYYDPEKLAAFLDTYPNADVEMSATVQDLGRAPRLWREFIIKYQDRVLLGTDGNPSRGAEEFWIPHFRYPRDLRRVLRASGADSHAGRLAGPRPLEHLRNRPAGRCAAEGLLPERPASPAVAQAVDRQAARGTTVTGRPEGLLQGCFRYAIRSASSCSDIVRSSSPGMSDAGRGRHRDHLASQDHV